MTEMILRLPVRQDEGTYVQTLGGKGASLQRLIAMGLPVPPAVVVSAEVYARHSSGMDAYRTLSDETLPAHERFRKMYDAFEAVPLPRELLTALNDVPDIIGPGPYAVRSSATLEDSADCSCAGQFETILNVGATGLPQAVRHVWASMWSERAFSYRSKQQGETVSPAMAVVIQRQIEADASGVLFTCDPVRGDRSRIVIEAVSGLGESLVSGRTTPDRWTLSKEPLTIVDCSPAGTEHAPEKNNSDGLLDSAIVLELARLGQRVEQQEGCQQDIEWAVAGGTIYVLQARPVTALPPAAESRQIWTNVNTAEVLPDVMTPMTWSMTEPLASRLLGHYFDKLGIDLTGYRLIGQIAGRAYINLNTLLACARRIPGMGEKGITEMFGGQQEISAPRIAKEDLPPFRLSLIKMVSRIPSMLLEFFTFSTGRGQAILNRVRRAVDAEAAVDTAALSPAELVSRIHMTAAGMIGDTEAFDLFGMGKTYDMVLYSNCQKWFGKEGHSLASRMLAGLGGNENAQAGLDLWELANAAARDESVRNSVLAADSFAPLRPSLAQTPAGREFMEAWDKFMIRHGHHCLGELELLNPRWAETPDYVLKQVQSYLRAIIDKIDDNFLARYNGLTKQCKQVEAEVRRRLRNPLKRAALNFLLRKSRDFAPLRESIKSEIVRRGATVRRWLLELGRRLTALGLLADRDDVFFLLLDELEDTLRPGCDSEELCRRLATRRQEYLLNQSVTPPAVVVGRFDARQAQSTPQAAGATTNFAGVAVNPGVVVGPARVILRAGEDHVRPGEILVAPFTDPGWTPYFLNAAAIVMDIGGILSHGSIVAREFGIPAVVNVGHATQLIRTGQLLEVDGGSGTVRVLSAPCAREPVEKTRDGEGSISPH
jgi:pyruvate,water dikinase